MTAAIIHSAKLEATDVNSVHTLSSFAVPAGSGIGNKRLTVVLLTARGTGNTPARTVTSVTHNGVALTPRPTVAAAVTTGFRVAIYDLALGSTSPTGNIVATWSGTSTGAIIHAFVLEDVEQGTPTPTAVTSNNLSDALTLSAPGIILDAFGNCSNNTASNFSITGATQTQTSLSPSRTAAGTTNEQNLGTSTLVAGAGTHTFAWTATNSPNKAHVMIGYLQVSTSGTTVTITPATLAYAGQAVDIIKARTISITPAALTYTGQAVAVIKARVIAASTALLSYAGQLIRVDKGGGVAGFIRETWIGFRSGLGF